VVDIQIKPLNPGRTHNMNVSPSTRIASMEASSSGSDTRSQIAALQQKLQSLQKQLTEAEKGSDADSQAQVKSLTQQIEQVQTQIEQLRQEASRQAEKRSQAAASSSESDNTASTPRRAQARAEEGETLGTQVDEYA
jgi:chromosome segregation ATPase